MAEIMVDIDDTLMPWAELVRDEAVALGMIPPSTTWSTWEQWKDWGISRDDWHEAVSIASLRGLYVRTSPYIGAVETINRLSWEGHGIHIVTARRGANIGLLTRSWLEDHGFSFDTLTFATNKLEAQDAIGSSFDYAIDDGGHNYSALDEAGIGVYLMDQPHNQHIETDRRVHSLAEFANHISKEDAWHA